MHHRPTSGSPLSSPARPTDLALEQLASPDVAIGEKGRSGRGDRVGAARRTTRPLVPARSTSAVLALDILALLRRLRWARVVRGHTINGSTRHDYHTWMRFSFRTTSHQARSCWYRAGGFHPNCGS
jgi:hypothetical protein